MPASAKTTQEVCHKSNNVFTGIRCFKGTFSLQVKESTKSYQVSPRHWEYMPQEPLRKGLQEQQNIATRVRQNTKMVEQHCNYIQAE